MENDNNALKTPAYADLIRQLDKGKVVRTHLSIDDLPKEILYDGRLASVFVEYAGADDNGDIWHAGYKDNETGKIIVDAKAGALAYACSNLLHSLSRGFDHITDKDGKGFRVIRMGYCQNKHEYRLVDVAYKVRAWDPGKMLVSSMGGMCTCPYCDSENVKSEYYMSSPESWRALAGREQYNYECKDCGYRWETILKMS